MCTRDRGGQCLSCFSSLQTPEFLVIDFYLNYYVWFADPLTLRMFHNDTDLSSCFLPPTRHYLLAFYFPKALSRDFCT
uniref:Uncharacterized protein n=1 Tax=Anguilla anguilla TaxID=7936 RepID=A0A0E9WYS6_ANGAN